MKIVFKIRDFFSKIIDYWCIFLLFSLTILVIISVFLRYLFSISFVWYEELISMMFLAVSIFGMVIALRDKENISISYFLKKLPKALQVVVGILISIIIIFTEYMVFKYSLQWIEATGDVLTSGLRVPYKTFYYMLPVTAVMMIFVEALNIFETVSNLFKKGAN